MKKQLKRVRKGIYAKKPSYIRGVIRRKKMDRIVISSLKMWYKNIMNSNQDAITLGDTTYGGEVEESDNIVSVDCWQRTSEIAFKKGAWSRFGTIKILMQRWINVFDGTDEWREIETIEL